MAKKLLISILMLFLLVCTVKQTYAKQKYVSFTFDDGWSSIYDNAFPILNNYKFPATLFVVTDGIGKWKGFMNWDQVTILFNNRWEIGSHTHNHHDLTTIDQDKIEYELEHSKKILKSKGFNPIGFASPFGNFNGAILALVKKHYKYHRNDGRATDGLKKNNSIDLYNIFSFELKHDMSFEEIKWIIDNAFDENKWLILHTHRVVEGKATEYEISAVTLQKIVAYLKSKNVEVVTIADFLKAHKLLQ